MKNVGYYNGKIGPLEEMMIPMNDRAVFFGDGCYDATLCANHIPFALEDIQRYIRNGIVRELSED